MTDRSVTKHLQAATPGAIPGGEDSVRRPAESSRPRELLTKQQRAAEYACGCFNELYPVGQKVVLTKDDGSTLETTTRSEAYVSDAGYPVIFLNGVRGYYILQRVRAI